MPLPFNKSLDLKLLKLVKENSILYNTKHAKYLDFDAREVIWQKIGDILSRPAADFAGIQCQINFGDYQEKKHKPGFIENLQEFLPEQYSNTWGIEKKILKAYSQHQGLSELEAKFLYIKTARALPTYGVTFFLVKEKQKDKKKLVPRLLGINAEAILRLDEVTKEILQQWPLTHVKTYHAGKSQTFTLNFGDYSDKEYSVKTQDCLRIRDILEGYIDIIRRRMLAKPHAHPGESMVICQDNVQAGKSHLIEHVSNNPSQIITETFVGPSKLLPYDQGSQARSGATLTTVQQIVVTDHLQNQQQALKGEIPVRGDMSQECVRKLNRMNSNSVKIVGLLTDPNDVNVKDAQKIVENMQEDLTVVEKGVKETAEKQALDDAKKMLLDELEDLNNYMNKLAASTRPGHVDPNIAKDAAENIADLTTQMYFSIDPKTRRRSELIRRSRKSFRAGEKKEQTERRASFTAAASAALHSVDTATQELSKEYSGQKPDDAQRKELEKSLEDKMGKLNAAIALYLTAHSDPESVDYSAAINSMNAINELMPELAKDAQILASIRDPNARKELQDDMRTLFQATRKVCGLTGTEDHEKMQEATNHYADIAGKLIFNFARGSNAQKEDQIIQLAKNAGDKTSLLLVTANELTCQAAASPAAADVDVAGVRTAGAARDLLACAQLTAPAIHEPHCQSALTAASEGLASSVHNMESSWRPLLEDPTRQPMSDQLHVRATDVMKALERLKDAYANLGGVIDADDASLPLQERQRLKFMTTMSGVKNSLQGVDQLWKESAACPASEQQRAEAQRRLEQNLAQLNAAVAALTLATADRENPDYATAELAISTISELMPQIVKDTEVASSDKDAATRSAMLQSVRALCEAARDICRGDGYRHGQGEAASNFAAATGKLVFLISPEADKQKENQVMDIASAACGKSSELLSQARRLRELLETEAAAQLGASGARADDATAALHCVAQVTAPSISSARCLDALSSAVLRLRSTAADLTSSCQQQLQDRPDMLQHSAAMMKTQKELEDYLRKLANVCQPGENEHPDVLSAKQEKQRLKFINSVSGAKSRLDAAEQRLNDVKACQMMRPENATVLQHQLCQRLAQLNAAVAALAAATSDRENPDYGAAEKAISTISELMPHIVQDSRVLCGTKSEVGRDSMLQDVRALCEACHEICDSAAQPQGMGEVAAKFAAASGNMVFLVSPSTDSDKQNEVLDLSSAACGKASELLAQVQSLTQQVEPRAAAELDSRGARAAHAAQALLTVAQVTGPSIFSDAHCQDELVSAAEKLRTSTAELTASCGPQLQQRRVLQQQVLATQQQLHDSLDKLVHACKTGQVDQLGVGSSAQQEKRRLEFINSVSGAKSRLGAAEQRLKEPIVNQLKPEDATALQHKLSQRLAQLNAAVAALAAATSDRENPDYAAADRAVKTITELIPQIAQDSHVLSGTKDDAGRAAMLQDVRALCEASREMCDSAGQPQGLGDMAAKFSAASGKLVFLISPVMRNAKNDAQEKDVVSLSASACGKTTELLAQVQSLAQQIHPTEPRAAAELDSRGARAADAAQALLTVAQLTASNISEPACSNELISSAEKLRKSAVEMTASCGPHLQQRPELQQQVLNKQLQLIDSLKKLVHACQAAQRGPESTLSPQQEKQRLQFVGSMSAARKPMDASEELMKEPVLCQLLKEQDGAALQHQLSQRLAQLNAAVAALAAATSDCKNPDYPAAERAITTITELMPQLVQDSRTLCGTKDEAGQAATLEQLRALCEAGRAICDSAGQPRKLHEASTKLANASGKLQFLISPDSKQQIRDAGAQGSKPVPGKRPPVPVRDLKHRIAPAVPAAAVRNQTQEFIDTLVSEENRDNPVRMVGINAKTTPTSPNMDKQAYEQFSQVVDSAEKEMTSAEDGLRVLHDAKSITIVGAPVPALEVTRREQHMEDTLATAAVEVASLVAANYADKLDYKAALEPTKALTKSVKSIVEDGGVISGSLYEDSRKPFIDDMTGLCHATKDICKAARSDKEKLNDAAITFGNQSAKLLRVVSSEVNTDLEKEVISRAKAIGDTASRLALEASNVASSAGSSTTGEGSHVQDICTAGTRCVDAAGKLVYTAKLVAPTIHHATCQDALISSADSLSSSLATFSDTWKPLASTQQPGVQKLTEEARKLEELLEKLRGDIKVGKLGKKKEVDQFVKLDMPLKQMTVQIIDNAKNMAEHGELRPELKQEYHSYSNRLADGLRALDLANARYQRALHDNNKRNEMEVAIQDLQMTALQTRPSRAGQETNNIVDFRDFLQDLAKEAEQLQQVSQKHEGAAGKRVTDDIKFLCSTINEDASKLLHPPDNRGDGVLMMNSVDDIMDIAQFGQECDVMVKEINAAIQGIHDQKAKQALRAKALPLTESCHLLRFATNSHISATKSVEFDEALRDLDNFKTSVMQPLVNDFMQKKKEKKGARGGARSCRAGSALVRAGARAAGGRPAALSAALAHYSTAILADTDCEEPQLQHKTLNHLNAVLNSVQTVARSGCMELSNFEYDIQYTDPRKLAVLKELTELDNKISSRKIKTPVLNAEDIDKLLLCDPQTIEGTPKQLEEKVQQLSSKLSSMGGTIVSSAVAPASLARSLHAAAAAAAQLAAAARALKQHKKPFQGKKIEDAAHEMCLATYSLMKTSEIVCQDPNHHDSRRKMMEACRDLNDSINKLVRSVGPGSSRLAQECGEAQRGLQLQRAVLQLPAPPPAAAMPYDHCLDTLHEQRDILQKLNSDEAMSRSQFLQSVCYVTSAASNSADCAAHAAYLLSVSEKDSTIGKEGIVDVSKLHKAVREVEDTCVSIIMGQHEEQIQEERKVLQTHVQDLLDNLNDAIQKTKAGDLKDMLIASKKDVQLSSQALYNGIDQNRSKPEIISLATSLIDDVNNVAHLAEHPDLVPTVRDVSADTQAKVDEVVKSSLSLLTNTEELIKQVKSAPDEPEVMKWVMFNKRKDVLDAFEDLLRSIKSNGVKAGLLERSIEDSEEEKKSYVQKQFDTASKWLQKSMTKAEVKTNGQQAVRNLIEVANKITEDLKGIDKDDMRHLVEETQQILTECSKKYDQEQYSVLMERVRELKKGIERGVVTRVVEDFMEAEAPLADLDILADYEKDETKRKFLLEKKIAELLAHLSRVTKTARLLANTDGDTSNVGTQLNTCSEQAELLAPMLVKAAQQRVASPDDKVVIENYKALLARYAESVSKIRDLCDQSVDPMDFVQTAGETMQRMREESAKHNDPMKCAHTSAAITKLANRVINVGMSSSCARADPELAQALSAAQRQLRAAAPPADTRASRMPDWKDTTAKILQATEEVESLLGGETIFKKQPEQNQPIYNEALNLHFAIRDWSSRDNEIVAVAKRTAVLMAKLSNYMNNDKQHEVLATSKSIVTESHEVARLAKKLAHECSDHRIKTNLLQTCERIPTISGQLKMLTTVKGFSLGRHGTQEDKEAMDMLVGNAQSLMLSIQDVVKGAASASVKIMSQRGPRMKWVRKTIY